MSDPEVPMIDLFDLGSKGLQHHGLRRANERAVLTAVGFNPGLSNAEIARMSGLAPQTVSAILNDVETAGLISRGEVLRGRRGQPATPIFLKAEGAYSVGLEIGWRHAHVVAIDLHGAIVARARLDYDEADLAILPEQIARLIAGLIADWPQAQRQRLMDLGVCLPGTIHSSRRPLDAPVGSKTGPSQALFASELERLSGLNVTLFNDGSAACWAELIAHPAPRPESFIYLLVSTYLAAGLIGEGRLWQGPTGHSADLGAMLVPNGADVPRPAHAIASMTTLAERLAAGGHKVDLADTGGWNWAELEDVIAPWIEDCARALAFVVYNTNAVIEAELVVLDTVLPQVITIRLAERLSRYFQALPVRRKINIVAGRVGEEGPALGAAELSLYRRYFSRQLFEKS